MNAKRREVSGALKAKIALEALRADQAIEQVAARHKVSPDQVSAWMRQATEGLEAAFSNNGKRRARDQEKEVRALHAKIRKLRVERDFLSRTTGR